jgi:hypothetical protein
MGSGWSPEKRLRTMWRTAFGIWFGFQLAQPPRDDFASALDTINSLLLARLTKVLLDYFVYDSYTVFHPISLTLYGQVVPSIPIQTTNRNLIDSHIFIVGVLCFMMKEGHWMYRPFSIRYVIALLKCPQCNSFGFFFLIPASHNLKRPTPYFFPP